MRTAHKKVVAQAASELAIFGAILLFVVAGLIKAGFQQSMNMNQSLRSMRMALSESWRTSQGAYSGGEPSIARASAGIMLIEDHLSIDPTAKYGTRDRSPLVSQGAGTLSQNLFLDREYGVYNDLPILDLIVNGQRFPLTTANYTSRTLPVPVPVPPAAGLEDCLDRDSVNKDTRCILQSCFYGRPPCGDGRCSPGECADAPDCPYQCLNDCPVAPATPGACGDGRCLPGECNANVKCHHICNADCPTPGQTGAADGAATVAPCVIIFKRVYRYPNSEYLPLADGDRSLPFFFDLDFDGTIDVTQARVPWATSNQNARERFNWQWQPMAAVSADANISPAKALMGDKVTYMASVDKDGYNPSYDVDGDTDEEVIYTINYAAFPDQLNVVSIDTADSQEGDLDPNHEPVDVSDNHGLQGDAQMYSYTYNTPKLGDGTYFEVKEGKLFTIDGKYIRNTNRNDHVDVIMRVLKLTNNTGRFCNGANPRQWDGAADCGAQGLCQLTNPVEVCVPANPAGGDRCFSDAFVPATTKRIVESTCMDLGSNTIFIRSRLRNIKGIRWLTRTGK